MSRHLDGAIRTLDGSADASPLDAWSETPATG
jgi:hypothetical protein